MKKKKWKLSYTKEKWRKKNSKGTASWFIVPDIIKISMNPLKQDKGRVASFIDGWGLHHLNKGGRGKENGEIKFNFTFFIQNRIHDR